MKAQKTIFIFISEEGFGHVVRVCSILNELSNHLSKKIDLHIFTGAHIDLLEQRLKIPVKIHILNSGLLLRKNANCSLDEESTLYNLLDWYKQLAVWENNIIRTYDKCDLIISDSVPQAGSLSKHFKCQAINISHFTWDWMYNEINKDFKYKFREIKGVQDVINRMINLYDNYDSFIFPPLTPKGNIELLKSRSRIYDECYFILSDSFINSFYSDSSLTVVNPILPKLLLMNNGTASLTESINKIICNWSDKYNINLIISPVNLEQKALKVIINSNTIYQLQSISDAHSALSQSNYFLARCGYNTFTESIFTRAIPILVSEESNPEIESNLDYASNKGINIIKPKDITTEKIITLISNISSKKLNYNVSEQSNSKLLVKGRIQCAEIIKSYLIDN